MSESAEEYLTILQLSNEEAIRDLELICQSMMVLKAQRASRRAQLAEIKLQAVNTTAKRDKKRKQKQEQEQEPGQSSEEANIELEDCSDSDTLLNYSVQSESLESQVEPQLQVKANKSSPPDSSPSPPPRPAKQSPSYLDGKTFGNRHRALLLICQEKMRPYGIPMYEFSMSFCTGHALCAFIHSYRPDLIDTKYLTCKNQAETLRYVEDVAKGLGAYFEGNFMKFMRRRRPGFVKIYNFVHQLYVILEAQNLERNSSGC